MSRLLVILAGIAGVAGVAASARGAHAGGSNLGTAGSFLIMHAAAFLGLAALSLRGSTILTAATVALAVGVALFAGDLAARELLGDRLFPMAAPIGGGLMILGWAGVAAAGLLSRRL